MPSADLFSLLGTVREMSFQTAKFTIQSLVRWSQEALTSLVVLHKGDETRGLITLQQHLTDGKVRFWVQETDMDGLVQWRRRFEEDQEEAVATDYIERERSRDEDLWVVVMDSSNGVLPPVLQQAKSDL